MDASPTCHTPDVLEAPYRPEILQAGEADSRTHDYRLAGPTCLAGDVFGDYSFDEPLVVGDRIVFLDQAPYTIVKTNSFNGIPLPSIIPSPTPCAKPSGSGMRIILGDWGEGLTSVPQ